MSSPISPTENERIALRRRWTKDEGGGWIHPITGIWQYDPPDYLGSWEHAGPLLEELILAAKDITLRIGIVAHESAIIFHASSLDLYTGGGKPETAIARAWLAWQEGLEK